MSLCVTVQGQTNNTLNSNNTITWGELGPDKPYLTEGYEADDGGLDPYFNLAKSFIDTSLPELLPLATTKNILDGTTTIQNEWQGLAKSFWGFSLCIVIGFLFIFIFPIVGCCFCCCRCCGKCGGKRIKKQDDNATCKRYVFSAVLFVLASFVIAGAACTFVSSDQLHKNIGGLGDSVQESVDDVQTFIDNIHGQFQRLGDVNFVFLKDVLIDYVQDISGELSTRLITEINTLVNLDTPLNDISALSQQAVTQITDLESNIKKLKTERDTAVTNLENIKAAYGCPSGANCIQDEIDILNGLDFTTMQNTVATFKTRATTNVFDSMKTDLDNAIESEVKKSTGSLNVADKLNDIYSKKIKPMLEMVSNLKTKTANDLDSYSEMINDYTSIVKPYDKYRWYAGVALASFLTLIALLMLVGVLMGVLCGSANDKPTERGGASNCAGIMLMSAVGLIFIFGALLMLLTTLMYLFGSLTERYLCQSFDDLSKVEEYTSQFNLGIDMKNISFNLNGNQISTGVSALMNGCQQGKTLYDVLGLQAVVDSSLSEIDAYKSTINKTIVDNLKVSDTFAAANGKVDVSAQIAELDKTVDSAADLKNGITNMKNAVTTARDTINTKTATVVGTQELTGMITTLSDMETQADNIGTTAANIRAQANIVDLRVTDALTKLSDQAVMEPLISNVVQDYVGTLFGLVDSYLDDVKSKLSTTVGKCTPVYSIFRAVFAEAFCHGIIDPLNGFWLALGWCIFFFMPGLILSVKLAKHFRQMLYDDSYAEPTINGPPPYYTEASGKGTSPPSIFPPMNGNKVAPF